LSALTARSRAVANGFWLLPALIACAFAVLALVLVRLDHGLGDQLGFTFDGDAGAARAVLETVAGSLITVAGLTFSLTVVVLVLVSGQFTPRSVPAFLADRVNQATAGIFIGVFVYCLLVLRTVRDADANGTGGFVPKLSVTVAVAAAVGAIAILLYFIHHLGNSIQASSIVRRIGVKTLGRIEELPSDPFVDEAPSGEPGIVRPTQPGYLRHVALADIAERVGDCKQVRLRPRVGEFITEDDILAEVWPRSAAEDAAGPIRRGVVIGQERDLHQDVLYGVRQLAEIAMKGLSPGVNDPSTAESAIGYLRAVLQKLAQRPLPLGTRRGNVAASLHTFDDYVQGAFEQVGRYATADPDVVVTLLEALAHIAAAAHRDGRHERTPFLRQIAEGVALPALERTGSDRDREHIRSALARIPESRAAAHPSGKSSDRTLTP
jgi:uncharacterized membrane protein